MRPLKGVTTKIYRIYGLVILSFLGLLTPCSKVQAQTNEHTLDTFQPRYELGVGAVRLNLPKYPGSKKTTVRNIFFPWIIYRGEYLRIDDEGQRTLIKSSNRYELSIAPFLSFPIKSGEGPRKDMPNLDFLVGIGPQFILKLSPDNSPYYISTTFSMMGVFSTNINDSFKSEGVIVIPRLKYSHRLPNKHFSFFSSLQFQLGSIGINRYFYEVPTQYATSERPAYKAQPGIIKYSTSLGLSFSTKNLTIFTSGSLQSLELSENKQSPLIETRNNTSLTLGVVWTFWKSKSKIRRIPVKM